MKWTWLLLILVALFLPACAEPMPTAQVMETTTPSKLAAATSTTTLDYTATPTPKSTATIWPTRTKMIISTLTSVVVPEWAKEPTSELYLCFAPDENEVMRLAVINPITQETFLLPIREEEIQGYFWLASPTFGVGWIWHGQYRGYNEYATLDFSTGNVGYFDMPEETREFLQSSLTGWERGEQILTFPYPPLPLKMVNTANGKFYLLRQDVDHRGQTQFQDFTEDDRYVFFTMFREEEDNSNSLYLQGFDLYQQEEIVFEIIVPEDGQLPDWPITDSSVLILGGYIINMKDQNTIYKLPLASSPDLWDDMRSGSRAWDIYHGRIFYNPANAYYYDYTEDEERLSIYVYDIDSKTIQKMEDIESYFQYQDTFSLENEVLYNLTYIPTLDSVGFSYYGDGTNDQNQYDLWFAGGYCLYSIGTEELDCFTDAIEEMYIVFDSPEGFTAREEVVYAQWSDSNRFIAFFVRVGDDTNPARILIYDLETGSYFYIDNYSPEPLGVWSP